MHNILQFSPQLTALEFFSGIGLARAGISYKAAMDLRIYTDRENFDVPAHATASLVKDFEKTFHLPFRIQWFPGSSHRNELVEAAQKL